MAARGGVRSKSLEFRLRIWGSDVRIVPGAPFNLLSGMVFSFPNSVRLRDGLQLVCKLCSRRVLKVEDGLLGEAERAGEIAFQNPMHRLERMAGDRRYLLRRAPGL